MATWIGKKSFLPLAAVAICATGVLWSFARALENVLWCYESGEAADDDLALAKALV